MSAWSSYVYGVVIVDTLGKTNAESMYIAQTVINHLPKIYGIDDEVKYYLNLSNSFPSTSNCDEFLNRSNLGIKKYRHHRFEHNSKVIITIEGYLGYFSFENAVKEVTKVLSRLSSRLWVTDCLVIVTGSTPSCDFSNQFIFNNPEWILNREDSGWVNRKIFNRME